MIGRENDSEGNCLNQLAGILEDYASEAFAETVAKTPTEVMNLDQQQLCFYDFYDAVSEYAERAKVDFEPVVRFAAALDAAMEERDAKPRSAHRDELFTRSVCWAELQHLASQASAVIQKFPKYSREWCDAMRVNRTNPATIIPAEGFSLPDGFYDEP